MRTLDRKQFYCPVHRVTHRTRLSNGWTNSPHTAAGALTKKSAKHWRCDKFERCKHASTSKYVGSYFGWRSNAGALNERIQSTKLGYRLVHSSLHGSFVSYISCNHYSVLSDLLCDLLQAFAWEIQQCDPCTRTSKTESGSSTQPRCCTGNHSDSSKHSQLRDEWRDCHVLTATDTSSSILLKTHATTALSIKISRLAVGAAENNSLALAVAYVKAELGADRQ